MFSVDFCLKTLIMVNKLKYIDFGEMAEWLKAAVLKTVIGSDLNRGFESHSLLFLPPFLSKYKYNKKE